MFESEAEVVKADKKSKIVFPTGHIKKCKAIFNSLKLIRRTKNRTNQG